MTKPTKELIIESPTYGQFTVLIDEEDWDKVSRHAWNIGARYRTGSNKFHVRTSVPHPDGGYRTNHGICRKKQTTLRLHQLIMNTPKGMQTDHINGDTLDNRKENLRICTHTENICNRGAHKNNRSGYKGVTRRKTRHGRWAIKNPYWARIYYEKKEYSIGYYPTAEEAARAYDAKAKELHGEFAYLNFPDE
jgi:hypothetical protein